MAKKKKRKKNHPHDKLIKFINDSMLTGEGCMISAAVCLMESGKMYKKNNDPEGLIRVAAGWYDIGRVLLGLSDHNDDEQISPFGFGVANILEGGASGTD